MMISNQNVKKAGNKPLKLTEKLMKHRKIVISSSVNSELAKAVICQLLVLDEEDNQNPITIFINSPGGEVYSGFAIYDMIQSIRSRVITVVVGFAGSMGSVLSLAASKGSRYALKNAKFLLHQPLISNLYRGSVSDVQIQATEMIVIKKKIIDIYHNATGKDKEEIKKDINRDFWISSEEALNYGPNGLIDAVVSNLSEIK